MKHPALLIDDSHTPTPDRTEAQIQEPADDDFGLIRALWFSIPASLAILAAGLMGIYLGDFVQWLFF
jgi:hypothetical protein